ncbi:MAG: M23 family metallopeptidase [Anaerolineae bacterium]|nr:M23 family metallopeptidase [Anaerolineae bacterium]
MVNAIDYPVNPDGFTLAQDYAAASPRHQGRFHTGEDWYGGRGNSFGQPVRAVARGRVVYSFAQGWGRDGGVVIIEHTFSDGSLYYSQYGHMQDTEQYPFPTRLSCVAIGDIIGSVGDARPAPHIHFEIRRANGINGTEPGPGYTREIPYTEDYRNPSKFIRNQQAWLHPTHIFHTTIGTETSADERNPRAPPLVLNDNSVLYLSGDGMTLRRATNDGRVLWRARLDSAAVAIEGWQGNSLLTYADGTMQLVNVETGGLGESWQIEAQLTGAAIFINGTNDTAIYPSDSGLLAVSANRREIIWKVGDIPAFRRAYVTTRDEIALISVDNELLYLSSDSTVIERNPLRAMASFASAPDGTLLAYTLGGLWQIDNSGEWSLYIEDAPRGSNSSALLNMPHQLLLFDGVTLQAYDFNRQAIWRSAVPLVSGLVELDFVDNLILLTSNAGNIAVITEDGRFCNQIQIWGNDEAHQWHDLGADGVLRVAIADQIIGLNWELFTRPCRI